MSTHPPYGPFDASDIQRYLQGEMSAGEMHALESAALEDPFLADVLEGMEKDQAARGSAAFSEDLARLRKELQARVQIDRAKKNRIAIAFLFSSPQRKAAAVIILLAGLGALSYRYLFRVNGPSPALAKTTEGKQTTKTPPAATTEPYPPAAIKENPGSKKAAGQGFEKAADHKNIHKTSGRTDKDLAKQAAPAASQVSRSLEGRVAGDSISLRQGFAAAPLAKEGLITKKDTSTPVLHDVVVMAYGKAKKQQTRAQAISADTQARSAAGADMNLGISAFADKNIATGAGVDTGGHHAEPTIGWIAYRKYLEDHKQVSSADSTRKGTEIISFIVNKKGKLSSFKVEQSLSPAHDSTLIRLIREGPGWKWLDNKHSRKRDDLVVILLSY